MIESLSREEADLPGQEFLAPLLRQGRARLRLHNLVYEFAVANAQPGWWLCRICDAQSAVVVDEALPWQRGDYLALWPVLRMVLVEPLHDGADAAWLALPYNPAEAQQRFGVAGPLVLHLVEGGQPFERVIGRVEGCTLWYDDIDRRANPSIAEALRQALAAEQETPTIANLGVGERAAYTLYIAQQQARRAATEAERQAQQVRHALEIGGARLLGYEQIRSGLRVTWERDGQRSVTLVDTDLNIVSAGICLSGEDHHFDLTSIIGVVRDAPDFARYGNDDME